MDKKKKNLTFEQVSEYFDIPLVEASQKFNMSGSTFIRTVRKLGIEKWPYRKIQSIDTGLTILFLEFHLKKHTDIEIENIFKKSEQLYQLRTMIITDPNITLSDIYPKVEMKKNSNKLKKLRTLEQMRKEELEVADTLTSYLPTSFL